MALCRQIDSTDAQINRLVYKLYGLTEENIKIVEGAGQVKDEPLQYVDNDGLFIPEVGSWAMDKYRLVSLYGRLFSSGMKKAWHQRIYVDLFAGAGMARIRGTEKILAGSPLLALSLKDKYNRYIFCEQKNICLSALQQRVSARFPGEDVQYVRGDCNTQIEKIVGMLPSPSIQQTFLTFCFVDPYSLNIQFETIRRLSGYFVDFLILLAFSMDANRNLRTYFEENHERIEGFLGIKDWRKRWTEFKKKDGSFPRFLAREHTNQMINLGYLEEAKHTMVEMRSDEKNLPLYHLAFYSRHPKGYEFWAKVRKAAAKSTLFDGV